MIETRSGQFLSALEYFSQLSLGLHCKQLSSLFSSRHIIISHSRTSSISNEQPEHTFSSKSIHSSHANPHPLIMANNLQIYIAIMWINKLSPENNNLMQYLELLHAYAWRFLQVTTNCSPVCKLSRNSR